MDLLGHLDNVENTTSCQLGCQNLPNCNFFTFLKEEQSCKLQAANFDTRVCDIVHGTSSPSFESCLLGNKIPWENTSGTGTFAHYVHIKS